MNGHHHSFTTIKNVCLAPEGWRAVWQFAEGDIKFIPVRMVAVCIDHQFWHYGERKDCKEFPGSLQGMRDAFTNEQETHVLYHVEPGECGLEVVEEDDSSFKGFQQLIDGEWQPELSVLGVDS